VVARTYAFVCVCVCMCVSVCTCRLLRCRCGRVVLRVAHHGLRIVGLAGIEAVQLLVVEHHLLLLGCHGRVLPLPHRCPLVPAPGAAGAVCPRRTWAP
jgi:hypothetical protein